MAISEEDRHDMHSDLERLIGRRSAATLMAHLPPVGWADVATKQDLEILEARLMGRMDQAIVAQTWRLVTVMVALFGATFGGTAALIATFH